MTTMILGALAATFLVAHLGAIGLYLRRLRQPLDLACEGVIGTPPVTLLRPVCGVDAFDAETLASSFAQDYPDYEVIFCAPSESDPAVPLVRRLIAAHPQVKARLLCGLDAVTGNPKLNNVWKGWKAARHDWIAMTDSNLMLPRDYLARLVAAWGPATGVVSAPPTGLRPTGFGGHLECAFLNTNQAVLQFASASLGPAYAQGKTLFFNRPLVEHGGGLRALGAYLAEDVATTHLLRAMGREVTLTPLPFAQPIGQRNLRQVWDRQLRWSRVRRDGFPLLFAFEWMNGGVVPALITALALWMSGAEMAWAAGYVALWYLAQAGLAKRAGWPMGARDLAAMVVRDAMIPAIWVATFARRGFEWRGNVMEVAAPQAPQAAPPTATQAAVAAR